MTDTLPSGATEKARRIDASLTYESNPQKRDELIATALLSAYQQGKQDGQMEMKERAAKVADSMNFVHRVGSNVKLEKSQALIEPSRIAAAIRRLDEVQDARS